MVQGLRNWKQDRKGAGERTRPYMTFLEDDGTLGIGGQVCGACMRRAHDFLSACCPEVHGRTAWALEICSLPCHGRGCAPCYVFPNPLLKPLSFIPILGRFAVAAPLFEDGTKWCVIGLLAASTARSTTQQGLISIGLFLVSEAAPGARADLCLPLAVLSHSFCPPFLPSGSATFP